MIIISEKKSHHKAAYAFAFIILFPFLSCEENSYHPSKDGLPVEDAPFSSFSTNLSVARKGDTIQFINESDNASTYFWDFGDGNASASKDPFHVYASTGIFRVSLMAVNAFDTSMCSKDIIIKEFTVIK